MYLKVILKNLISQINIKGTFKGTFKFILSPHFSEKKKKSFEPTTFSGEIFLGFFYVKIHSCLYFTSKMIISQFSRACSHYDVIVRPYVNGWYSFGINGKMISIPVHW